MVVKLLARGTMRNGYAADSDLAQASAKISAAGPCPSLSRVHPE